MRGCTSFSSSLTPLGSCSRRRFGELGLLDTGFVALVVAFNLSTAGNAAPTSTFNFPGASRKRCTRVIFGRLLKHSRWASGETSTFAAFSQLNAGSETSFLHPRSRIGSERPDGPFAARRSACRIVLPHKEA
jgi:hypothetical protein